MISKLVMFILAIANVQANVNFRKCCDNSSVLIYIGNDTSMFVCEQDVDREQFTSLVVGNDQKELEFGIPRNCLDGNICVDKLLNGTIIELKCDNESNRGNVSVSNLETLYVCCPRNGFYNYQTKSCISVDNWRDYRQSRTNSTGFINYVVGVPHCSGAIVDLLAEDLNILPNNEEVLVLDLLTNSTETFRLDEACIDFSDENGGTYAIRICKDLRETCKKSTCVSKCCKHGYMYLPKEISRKESTVCQQAWDRTFRPNFSSSMEEIIPDNFAVVQHVDCKHYIPNQSFVKLLRNGTVTYKDQYFFHPDQQLYCIENVNTSNQEEGTYILLCLMSQNTNTFFPSYIGLVVSCVFLAATLLVYCFLPKLRNNHGKIVMCHVSCLLTAFACLSVIQRGTTSFQLKSCIALGYIIMIMFFASFSWLSVMCFDIWWTFGALRPHVIAKKEMDRKFAYYCLFAFGLPIVLASFPLIADFTDAVSSAFQPKMGHTSCWFNDEKPWAHGVYFVLPIALLISCNIVFFIMTARYCIKVKSTINKMRDSQARNKIFVTDKQTLITNLKLFVVMGLCWIIEIVSTYVTEPKILWNILDFINVLDGVWIFIIFVMKRKVWKTLKINLTNGFVKTQETTQSSEVGQTDERSPGQMEILTKYTTKNLQNDF